MTTKSKELSKRHAAYANEVDANIQDAISAFNLTISEISDVISKLQPNIEVLKKSGEEKLLDMISRLETAIVNDLSTHNGNMSSLKKDFEVFKAGRPTNPKHLGDYVSASILLNQRALSYNLKAIQSTISLTKEFSKLVTTSGKQ